MPRRLTAFAAALAFAACSGTPEPVPAPVPTPAPVVQPTEAEAPAAAAPESSNPDALALFMEARTMSLDRSRRSVSGATSLLESAVRVDATFARAWAELALTYGMLDDATDPLVRRPKAKAAAERALAISGSSAPALAARGFVQYRFDWQWREAEADFTMAIAASPSDAFARHLYGVFLATLGRTDEALRELERAVELDPSSAAIRADLVRPLLRATRVADARAALDVFAATVSAGTLLHQLQSEVLAAEGRNDDSAESLWQSLALGGVPAKSVNELRGAYASGGVTAMIERRIRQLTTEVENGPSPPNSYRLATDLALAHASLKHRDETLHWLAVAIDLHEDAPLYMRSSASFDYLRDEPRFKELLRRAKFET